MCDKRKEEIGIIFNEGRRLSTSKVQEYLTRRSPGKI